EPDVLGIAGAIGGPPINSTSISGVSVATLSTLSSYSNSCTGLDCNLASADMVDLGNVVSHELGHYLGLNHPSEGSAFGSGISMSNPIFHDSVDDTPVCTRTDPNFSYGGSPAITHSSC